MDRDLWILERRGPRRFVDPGRVVSELVEEERTERGDVAAVATLFLANRECPWRCLMCDLWKSTTDGSVSPGAIASQVRAALDALPCPRPRRVKLYNAGSFFDPKAIPTADLPGIAAALAGFERVIVESHPALVGDACRHWRELLEGDLEVAMGLETAHPDVLPKLNKRMTVDDFRRAADRLRGDGIALRVFVLLGLPFLPAEESLLWACRSVEVAFDAGATAVSVIATRSGNGALDDLKDRGEFVEPTLSALEEVAAFGVALARGRVFIDLWELERLRRCPSCFSARRERLRRLNLTQTVPPKIPCVACAGRS